MSNHLHQPAMSKNPPRIRRFAQLLILGALVAIVPQWTQPSQAQSSRKFKCEMVKGVPTTIANTFKGNVPMIRWVKTFTGSYNSERRCNEVSMRLDRFNREGKLQFIRTGNVNTYPVLCIDAGVTGNTCPKTSVLVTLPKGTDSSQILQEMLDLRARASGNIINLGGQQLVSYRNGDAYVSIDRLLAQ
jgi:hypothetical protein